MAELSNTQWGRDQGEKTIVSDFRGQESKTKKPNRFLVNFEGRLPGKTMEGEDR